MKVSKAALVAALMVGGSALLGTAPAAAQNQQTGQQGQQPAAAAPQFELSQPERAALAPLMTAHNVALEAQKAGQTADWAPVQALLPAAVAAAQGPDARFLVAQVQLSIAVSTNNLALQNQATEVLLASPKTPQNLVISLLADRARRAFDASDFPGAERAFVRMLELNPNDTTTRNNLAIVRQRMGNSSDALALTLQNIQTQEAVGQPATEDMYRRAFSIVWGSNDRARATEFATKLAQNYPTSANWRNALGVYRELSNPGPALTLDALRLARAAGALTTEADYVNYVRLTDQGGLPGETKAVIDEAIARGALRANTPGISGILTTATSRLAQDRAGLDAQVRQARNAPNATLPRNVADALYGYGRYSEAAELYRLAGTRSGADTNLLSLRLGSALAMAGQRAEAETALRAVTGEPAGLAQLWLAWLARRQG